MDKEQMLKQIEELKKTVNPIKNSKTPKIGDTYWFLADNGFILFTVWKNDDIDLFRFNIGNCFKTKQKVKDYKENLLTKQELKDLALEFNNDVEINWEDDNQEKVYLFYNNATNKLETYYAYTSQPCDTYCLNNQFLSIAKKRIGEEKLIKLIKSGV